MHERRLWRPSSIFYRPPSLEDVARDGRIVAEVHARSRARILGSRALALTATLAIGTGTTLLESVDRPFSTRDTIARFAVPAIINFATQFRIERELRATEREVIRALEPPQAPDVSNENDNRSEGSS